MQIKTAIVYSVSSVVQSCLTLCDPMNHSTPEFPVHHQLPEFTQIHSFYGQVMFQCIYVPHLLYPSIDGHLGCFHVLAIVNSASVNTGVLYLFELWFSLDICQGVGFAGSYDNSGEGDGTPLQYSCLENPMGRGAW